MAILALLDAKRAVLRGLNHPVLRLNRLAKNKASKCWPYFVLLLISCEHVVRLYPAPH